MDDVENRAYHPDRQVGRERWEQPSLGGEMHTPSTDTPTRYAAPPMATSDLPDTQPLEHPPEQLQMFMSGREIMSRYRPLEGDRQDRDDYDDVGGTQTWRRRNTAGITNYENPQYEGEGIGSSRQTDQWGNKQYTRSHYGEMESDEQFWSRKEEESYDEYGRQGLQGYDYGYSGRAVDPHTTWRTRDTEGQTLPPGRQTSEYTYSPPTDETGELSAPRRRMKQLQQHPGREGKFGGAESLGQSLEQRGYDWSIHTDPTHERYQEPKYPISVEYSQEEGYSGDLYPRSEKPQIVGGHHRLSVMNKIAPDSYMPVVYADNIWEAQGKQGYT